MNKIKYFVFSDVHGEYNALMDSLREAGYDSNNPSHKLISVGDAFDRGPDSARILNFLISEKAIAVKGNHDVMLEEYLDKGMDGEFVLFNILHNGLGATIHSLTGLPDKEFNYRTVDEARKNINHKITEWVHSMPLYYETQNFIFVHAGLNPELRNWKDTDEHFMLWDIEFSHVPIMSVNKVIVIGHHHAFRVRQNAEKDGLVSQEVNGVIMRMKDNQGNTSQGTIKAYGNTDENRPYCYGNKIAIDGCTNLTKKVNVIVIEDYPLPEEKPVKEPEPESEGPVDGNIYISRNGNDGVSYYTYTNPFANVGITAQEFANITGRYATVTTTTDRWEE